MPAYTRHTLVEYQRGWFFSWLSSPLGACNRTSFASLAMQIPPDSVLATFPAPNYVNPEEHAAASSIVNLIFFPLCLLVIILRNYSRLYVSKSFGLDDILATAAIVCTIPQTLFHTHKVSCLLLHSASSVCSQSCTMAGPDTSGMFLLIAYHSVYNSF